MEKKAKKKQAGNPAPEADAVEVVGSLEYFQLYAPVAQQIALQDVLPLRVPLSLIYHNVADGVVAVLAERERIARELPAFELALVEVLPDIALALTFAASQVDRN